MTADGRQGTSEEAAGDAPPKRGPGRPRKVPAEEQRETILAAATKVFAERGYAGTTADDLAAAAGVVRPSIYDLIGSKSDVFAAAVERALRRIMDRYLEAVADAGDTDGRARALAHIGVYFELLDREPDTMRLVRMGAIAGEEGAREVVTEHRRALEQAIADNIRANPDVQAAGGLDAGDARVAATMLLAAIEAVAFRELEEPEHEPSELCEIVTDLYRGGILARVGRDPAPPDA